MQTPVREAFSLDHTKFREHLEREYGEPAGLDTLPEDGGLSVALATRLYDARDCDAIQGPENTIVHAYALNDALLISVRERQDQPDVPLRQVAAFSIETKRLAGREDSSFKECCAAIEEVLRYATQLLPLLHAMQTGERQADPAQHQLPTVSAYHATDGAVVVEINAEPVGAARHDNNDAPYLRVYVDDRRVFEHSPPTPLAGSHEARTHSDPDPDAPIGRLVVDSLASQSGGER
jgi:hypothetical protein